MADKILIVDDEPDVLKVLLLRLEKTGYEVMAARDAREALDLARQMIPDIIVLDFYLPDMNGDELVRVMKNDDKLKHIPVILISATTVSLAEKAKDCGAAGFIIKPFEPEELTGAIHKALYNTKEAHHEGH